MGFACGIYIFGAMPVGYCALHGLLSGLAVLYATLLATQDERINEAAILRTLGADSRYLRRLHLSEFAALGLLSGLFSAAGAVLLGWVLERFVLEIPYHASAIIWPIGGLGGVAGHAAIGRAAAAGDLARVMGCSIYSILFCSITFRLCGITLPETGRLWLSVPDTNQPSALVVVTVHVQ